MILFRALNPEVLELLSDRIIDDPSIPHEIMLDELRGLMTHLSENTHVQVLLDNELIVGFSISFHAPQRPFVFLVQAWLDPMLSGTDWSRKMFEEIKQFALGAQKFEIRAETQRNPGPFLRKWNFKTLSTVLTYKIGDDENGND